MASLLHARSLRHALVPVVAAALAGCGGGGTDHGFLGTNYQPSGSIVVTNASSGAVLTTSAAKPFVVSSNSFGVGLTETNFSGPYAVTITGWNNGTNLPCFGATAAEATGAPAIEQISAVNAATAGSTVNPCVHNGTDVETATISDGKGNTALFYFTLDSSAGVTGAATTTVSGDFFPLAANRAMNYQGTLASGAATFTLYDDPNASPANPTTVVLLTTPGTTTTAIAGTKAGALDVAGSATAGYTLASYTLYQSDGATVYAQGALPSGTLLVPPTLTVGKTFSPYAGMTATVQSVGTVAGSSACPAPATNARGATVQYAFQSQTYTVSYVPGCGITQYVGNHGEAFTLSSVASYQAGTLADDRTMARLSLLDNLKSAIEIVVDGKRFGGWLPGR